MNLLRNLLSRIRLPEMNFVQKHIIGGLSAVIGLVLTIVGLFTNGVVLTIGLVLFLAGVGFAGYNMYTTFSGSNFRL